MSSFGGAGNGYQPFTFPQTRKGAPLNEKVQESDSDRSGNLGFGMTEKEIDQRVRVFSSARLECFYFLPLIVLRFICEWYRYLKRWRLQWRLK
jgi:hypothetical protein